MKHFVVAMSVGLGSLLLAAQPGPPPVPPVPPVPAIEANGFPFGQRGGFIGLGLQEINADRAKALHLKEEAGVEIIHIAPASPAEKGGLKTGDVVLQYNGARVEGFDQFSRMVRETPIGREVKLLVSRGGAEQTVAVKIAQRPAAFPVADNMRLPDIPSVMPGMHSPLMGVDVESVSGQFADFFGVKEGVLVREVTKASPAEKAGLKAGDIIVRMDDAKITAPHEITAKLRASSGRTVSLVVMRDHKENTLSVEVPERRSGRSMPAHLIMMDVVMEH